MSEAQKLKKLKQIQARLDKATSQVPVLAEERDNLLFDLLAGDVSERRIHRECGVSRAAIYKAKKRRDSHG